MKLAAIDIGSNAIRFHLSTVLHDKDNKPFLKKSESLRFPLRLGHDVFSAGRISQKNRCLFIKLMSFYKNMMDLYEVNAYMACATSAMRESANGATVVKQVYEQVGLRIQIITGDEEAELIDLSVEHVMGSTKNYLHIDVGGGSTEVNLHLQGKKKKSKSFKIGSVRMLEGHDCSAVWDAMKTWVQSTVTNRYNNLIATGTGGSIVKLVELSCQKTGQRVSIQTIKETIKHIKSLSTEERINRLQIVPDRSDVIALAGQIYVNVMEWAGIKEIIAPGVGLKEGMLLSLLSRTHEASFPFKKG